MWSRMERFDHATLSLKKTYSETQFKTFCAAPSMSLSTSTFLSFFLSYSKIKVAIRKECNVPRAGIKGRNYSNYCAAMA